MKNAWKLALALGLIVGGMSACKPKTTAEKVEDKVEDAAHEAGQAAERAGEAVSDAAK
jgi:ribosomal protein S7